MNFKEDGLVGVAPTVRDDVEALQPHKRSPGDERSDALWHLRGLSNVDKHRLLHVVHARFNTAQIIVRPPVEGMQLALSPSRVVEDGAKIATLTIPRSSLASGVAIDGTVSLGLAVAKTAETPDLDLLVVLDAIRDRVREAIDLLSGHFS